MAGSLLEVSTGSEKEVIDSKSVVTDLEKLGHKRSRGGLGWEEVGMS